MFIRSCNIMIFKLLMTIISVVIMIVNSINTGTK